jgi:secreted PhoX family phosphatase
VLKTGLLSGVGVIVAGSVEAIAAPGAAAVTRRSAGYGPLVKDPAGILSLPKGFTYKVVSKAGETLLESGQPSPSDPDGAALFEDGSGGQVMVLNHEVGGSEPYPVPALPGLTYDPSARGGTTTLVMDGNGNRRSEYVSIAGTHNNCAGGRTPWDTWLTCEETEIRKGTVAFTGGPALQEDHGWVFEVDAFDRAANEDPVPLKFLGRYSHEAVAVDPRSSTIYLTEDANTPHGLYYRWTPPKGFTGGKGALRELALSEGGDTAGSLQAMSCSLGRRHIRDLSEATAVGTRYQVTWVDVPDPLAQTTSTRLQLTPDQVTGSRKLEGAYWGDGGAYFVASFARASDGSTHEHDGQVWFYDPSTSTVTLKSIFGVNPDPTADTHYDGPDNIVLDPHGGLILAEDGEGIQHLVGVTDQGKAYPLARNEVSGSEFAGPTFSEDGSLLFASIQEDGYTLAITGPWGRPSTQR